MTPEPALWNGRLARAGILRNIEEAAEERIVQQRILRATPSMNGAARGDVHDGRRDLLDHRRQRWNRGSRPLPKALRRPRAAAATNAVDASRALAQARTNDFMVSVGVVRAGKASLPASLRRRRTMRWGASRHTNGSQGLNCAQWQPRVGAQCRGSKVSRGGTVAVPPRGGWERSTNRGFRAEGWYQLTLTEILRG